MSLHRLAGLALSVALGFIALLHAFWALGGRWGLAAALGGADKPVPPDGLIWAVAGLLLLAVLVVLGRLGFWGQRLPPWIFAAGCWGLAAALLVAAVLNFMADTAMETFAFGPLATVLALLALAVALGRR